jgi:dimethylhistidine N-methyltransferase
MTQARGTPPHTTGRTTGDFNRDVIRGLAQSPRSIPPKYFYDAEGSRLFDAICEQPEYYPTRTEKALLERYAGEIARLIGPGCALIEPGCGNCEKVRLLLDTLRPDIYIPIDISGEHLQNAARQIAASFPWLDVHAVCTDITDDLKLPFIPENTKRVVFYPGSSIGNFEPGEAVAFLRKLAAIAGGEGSMLIGVDLQKDAELLNAAYNDAGGVTAAFNLNLLHRINAELGGNLDVEAFDHRAFYNEKRNRIEMHLVSNIDQSIQIDGHRFDLRAGDPIHTEYSYKYTLDQFQSLASRAGFSQGSAWTDPEMLFSLHYLKVG